MAVRRIPRRLARAPIGLFERGWGWVFAGRLMMLEHTGRRSGLPRRVVLEVVIVEPDGIIVPSGYGASSQWFRNILADPQVRVWWRRHQGVGAVAEVLDPQVTRLVLERYRARAPLRAAAVGAMLGLPSLGTGMPLPVDIGALIPLVRLRPTEGVRS